jgi:hypothetical protein
MGGENRQEFRWHPMARAIAASAMTHNDPPPAAPGANQTIKRIPAR